MRSREQHVSLRPLFDAFNHLIFSSPTSGISPPRFLSYPPLDIDCRIDPLQKGKDYSANMEAAYLSSTDEVLNHFQVDEHTGLSDGQAETNRDKFGRNGTVLHHTAHPGQSRANCSNP